MKPKTKREREVLELRKKLKPLTETQKKWMNSLHSKEGIYWKRGDVWCQQCGRVDFQFYPESMEEGYCPYCGAMFNMIRWQERSGKIICSEKEASIIQHIGEWNVIRTFMARRINAKGEETIYRQEEIFENWVSEIDGKEIVLGISTYYNTYKRWWDYGSEWSVKHHNGSYYSYDNYSTRGNYFYRITSVSYIMKRNGWRNSLINLIGVCMGELMRLLITDSRAEMLAKIGQDDLLRTFVLNSRRVIADLDIIKICHRNNYIVKDANVWLDYIDQLIELGYDTKNAKYVCPRDLIKEHDRLSKKIRTIRKKIRIEEQIKEAALMESQYEKDKGIFFGLCFGNENIQVAAIQSVAEIAEEGVVMHHCVYENKYFKKKDSLILSARDMNGNRLETIEINLKKMIVVQSRAKYNGISPYHNEIIEIVNKNMNLIAERMAV